MDYVDAELEEQPVRCDQCACCDECSCECGCEGGSDETDDEMVMRVLGLTVDLVDINRAVTKNAAEEKQMFSEEESSDDSSTSDDDSDD